MRLQIVTKTPWPSFKNVGNEIREVLQDSCTCTIHDWNDVQPTGKILFIGTIDNESLKFIGHLLKKNEEIVFYATTEGLSRLDAESLSVARHLKIVAVSDFVAQMIGQLGVNVTGVVHHAINMQETGIDDPFAEECSSRTAGRFVFLSVSANHHRKGLDQLLKAFQLVEQQASDAFLILHSQQLGYYDLHGLTEKLNLEHIWMTDLFGQMTMKQLNALYSVCSSYVQSSHSEGFGLPLLEAFKFNKPSIAVDAPPFNEIVKHKENGILIPSEGVTWFNYNNSIDFKMTSYSASKLAFAMNELLLNPTLLIRMREKIRAEKWKWDSRLVYPSLLQYFN